jgi:hypothetical protein
MESFQIILMATLLLLSLCIVSELFAPGLVTEGFSSITSEPVTSYWSSFTGPRSDIDTIKESAGYVRDPRYFNDYANVSRLGIPYDFCRMVAPSDDLTNLFFTCGLAGTDNLSSTSFRTPGTKKDENGIVRFRVSYDDYMRDVNGDGRDDYCRILPWKDNTYQPVCSYATDVGFESQERIDPNPPDDIQRLLRFYDSCKIWFRFNGDMLDTLRVSKVKTAGNMKIDETPRTKATNGLGFDGTQYIRMYDKEADLSMGTLVPLRQLRTFMCWAYFDDFTNNAKIFDFGNGSGKNNVFLGIVGKGDLNSQIEEKDNPCDEQESTVPKKPSGAQPVEEMSPQDLLTVSQENAPEYEKNYFITTSEYGLKNKRQDVSNIKASASLIYEVWQEDKRQMQIKIPSAIPLKKWIHITVTTSGEDPFRPDIVIYINGKFTQQKKSGWLPQTANMTNCYLGKSNWPSTGQYVGQDELFKGRLFDFRAYNKSLTAKLIKESYIWGKEKLGLE